MPIHLSSVQITTITPASTTLGTIQKPANNPSTPSGLTWDCTQDNVALFGQSGEVREQDVVQGGLGDCYMLSDLQQIARENPDFIKQHIQQVPNPSDPAHPNYAVHLFDQQGKPQTVIVDGKQLMQASTAIGAGGHGEEFVNQGVAICGAQGGRSANLHPARTQRRLHR